MTTALRAIPRAQWFAHLDQPCPTHEDATAGIPCQVVRRDDRLRTAICAERMKEAR